MPTPVEFDPFSADFFDDPYDTYRALRDHAPVYHSPRYGFWALSRFEDVANAQRDWRTFSSAHGVTLHDLTSSGGRIEPPAQLEPIGGGGCPAAEAETPEDNDPAPAMIYPRV